MFRSFPTTLREQQEALAKGLFHGSDLSASSSPAMVSSYAEKIFHFLVPSTCFWNQTLNGCCHWILLM
jgi:hypothetical protein